MKIQNSARSLATDITETSGTTHQFRNQWRLRSCLSALILGLTAEIAIAGPAPVPATPEQSAETSKKFDWSKTPPTTPNPRPGAFVMPATGPGYYSLMDLITGNERKGPPVAPYPPYALSTHPAFDVDFKYLAKPDHEKDFFDPVKRIHMGDDFLLSFGGQFWYRYMREADSRLTNNQNNHHLTRVRFHADLWYQDKVRIFAEFLDARTWSQGPNFSPSPTDTNHTDILNLFADIKIANIKDGPAYLRVGRQELVYGSQRLISTLDWANTRRTFQGVKGFWRTPTFDLDAFWVRPMVTEKNQFDNWDEKREFFGLWGTYKPKYNFLKGAALMDMYFLSLDDNRGINAGRNNIRGDAIIHTIGSRIAGNQEQFLYEIEGMYQFGQRSYQDISAFAAATGLGYQFKLPMNPQFWVRYDFASGDKNGQDGGYNTFNQLFPFGNYYMGWIDRVGRQNIHDFNAQFNLHPMHWTTLTMQYHRFYLANKQDFLYNAAGAGTLRDITGQSGSYVGDEIDVRFNMHVDRHQDVLVGYSKLFAGDFMKKRAPGVNPDLFYVQYNFRF